MLVLTRKLEQSVNLTLPNGEKITITLLRIMSAGKVRLGVEAPREVTILREEIE